MKSVRWIVPSGSIFPKLVLTFIAVMIPLSTLSLVLNELAKQEVKSQISDTMKARLHYEILSLEQEIERIMNSQQKAINDNDILDLTSKINIMSNYQRTETINRVSVKLMDLKDSSGLISKVSIYFPSIRRIVSTWGIQSDAGAIADVEAIAEAVNTSGFPITKWNNRLFIHLSSSGGTDFRNNPPDFVHQIELSVDNLKIRMNQISEGGGSSLYGEQWHIVNDDRNELAMAIQSAWGVLATESSAIKTVNVDGKRYLALYEKSSSMDLVLSVYIPEDILLGKLKSYRIWFWMLVGCSLIMILIFSYGIFLLIQRPLSLLVRQFRNVEEGNFNVAVKLNRKDEFGYLFIRFGRTVSRLKQLIDELYVQKIRLQQSELKQLQAQITPHFLYNSFFILNQLIKSYDIEKAEQVSKNLGAYFQYITRNGTEEVPLESEVNHVCSYMEIQNIRFSNRINVSIDPLPEEYRNLMVPRLILQPIIENAYQHGLQDIVSGGSLYVGFHCQADRLTIEVRDNGQSISSSHLTHLVRRLHETTVEGESTGMVNVHRRLQLKYGSFSGIELHAGEIRGLTVYLHIPIGEALIYAPSINRRR